MRTYQSPGASRPRSLLLALALAVGSIGASTVMATTSAAPAIAGNNTYPWQSATCVTPNPKTGTCSGSVTYDNWGYSICPSNDTGCKGLTGTLNGVTYGEMDPWGEYLRNCTSYVAWMLSSVNDFTMPFHDNAVNWRADATARGYAVNMNPAPGSVFWDSGHDHVGWVESVNPDGSQVTYEDYNSNYDGNWGEHTVATSSASGYIHFKDLSGGGGTSGSSVQMILDTSGNVWAKSDSSSSINSSGWNLEIQGGIADIAAGGGTQMALDTSGNVWAKSDSSYGSSGWTEEQSGGQTAIAAGDNGFQMILDSSGNVWAKNGIGVGGWTKEVNGGVRAIAAGGGTQIILDTSGNVWAKSTTSISGSGWNEEDVGYATTIAAGDNGFQIMIWGSAGSVYAQNATGDNWTQEVASGERAIAAGGGTQMILDTSGNVWAKSTTSISASGWTESQAGGQAAIAAGSSGFQMILDASGNVWAKNGISVGGWTEEVAGGVDAIATD